jgi:hypothetical protein
MVMDCSPTLINNTITQNRCSDTTAVDSGGGLFVYNSGSFNGMNNIIYNNEASANPEFSGVVNFIYSCSPVTLSGIGNITSNPQFVNSVLDDFHLQSTSPCIDTGNPSSPLDPDGSRADMGALYYDHAAATVLNVTLTPIGAPITVPANGGSFQFDAAVQRTQPPQTPFFVWTRDRFPNGSYTTPLLGPVIINPPVGVSVARMRTQIVPANWPAGQHWYIGYANPIIGYPTVDADSFSWTKLGAGDWGLGVGEAPCYGEPFPGEEIPPLFLAGVRLPAERGDRGDLLTASPNPFNPTTAISYKLQASSRVSLKVYDISGRMVANLVDGWQEAGSHEVTFDGSGLASGMYLVKMQVGDFSAVQKMMLVK